ncbi:phenylalanyl-tRNA synthetase beta subunit [Paenibacillus sp. UNCCL117]|uniref:phenylalanine--tRNA ligase subunit beta n=1 Tax=unclassified Paenibacillus TaxID=185978 RepID=UPI00087F674B|nr:MULTISPECIES: phenylalanine--tRNA ligase subunit beta [unclassified Paenibacillus]SDC00020.1 phenylalanyl-tRNA synthetase beta subunit [Paenibacillus sp. cl123]SFW69240.1 phenylalanyl-tRNA synthetase beta subunit [Paenibacillus sp. UNCCL117]
MNVSYQWLAQYVEIADYTAAELAEKLTRSGIEVDIVESRNKGVTGVVVGYVTSREKHPDADKLSVCKVDVGTGEELQIVCGAKNVDAGQKVPVATVGAKLPDGLAIKRAKLRGVESQGMICSAKELGLNDKLLPKEIQEGILVLPADTKVGESILDVLAINDEVMDLDLTPNRSDCLSMLGAAYEIAAILGREIRLPDSSAGIQDSEAAVKAAERISVEITAKDACSHYAARLIEGVKVGTSPLWLQNRLMAAGIRPISNIVDITNYVMLEYGQPLHAFDADRLENGHIDVRYAREGEKLVTLDDVERALEPHMLLITDGTKPVALAGVMGGANSEVTEGTTRILLESARFDGGTVRKTSRQLGLRSEASLRFEKEVNPEAVIPALDRAAALIAELGGGQVASGVVQSVASEHRPVQIEVTASRINSYLGTSLTVEEITAIFGRLNFTVEPLEQDGLLVHVPSRRGDITRAVDLIEEVARLYGYDNIPTTLMNTETTPGSLTKEQAVRRTVRRLLNGSGLHEAITYSYTHPDQIAAFPGIYREAKPVALAMPMSEERSVLRTSLVPHLIDAAVYNRNRNNDDVALFEIAPVFLTEESALTRQPEEKLLLSALLTGKRSELHWTGKPGNVDFYDLKGVFENIVSYLGIEGLRYVQTQVEGYHPGRTAAIEVELDGARRVIGTIGQLHPALQQARDLADTYVLEVEMEALTKLVAERFAYSPLPRFPASSRDMALVVDRGVAVGDLIATAQETAGQLLESIQVFDIYTGERVGADKKSVAIALVYRTADRTLTDEEVSELHGRVVSALEASYGAELRK